MGRVPGKEPSKSVQKRALKKLKPIHLEIAQRLVEGERQCDVARDLGYHQSWLSLVVYSPLFQTRMILSRFLAAAVPQLDNANRAPSRT